MRKFSSTRRNQQQQESPYAKKNSNYSNMRNERADESLNSMM